jgi:signal transduction histidine kinase
VQAMAQPGSPERAIAIRSFREGGFVAISLSDTGPGIPPEMAARLFEPFFTTKKEGMGMGLSICRSIIESHGGQLTHASPPGGGATFRFTLPVPESA